MLKMNRRTEEKQIWNSLSVFNVAARVGTEGQVKVRTMVSNQAWTKRNKLAESKNPQTLGLRWAGMSDTTVQLQTGNTENTQTT